jgi:glycosyltransferase involved in cell wall biosynthesis
MKKILCIYSFKESSWISCQKIVANLHKSYEALPDTQVVNYNFDGENNESELRNLATIIEDTNFDKIVFLDHKPHPIAAIRAISNTLKDKTPEIIFHLYGDFSLYYREWIATEQLLKNHKIKFVVASERQQSLVRKFLTHPDSCSVCPFPVVQTEFSFNESQRFEQRRKWNVNDDAFVLLYTGRLSRQKRIHSMISAFADALTIAPEKDMHLFLYGLTDNIADHFLNIWEVDGEYARKLLRIIEALPEAIASRIHFMGSLASSKLQQVYNGADYFISLSVHNDEDYGMSVAEAQACGLPCILSDWAGFSSFAFPAYPEATSYIPVHFGNKQKIVSKSATTKIILDVANQKTLNRVKISELFVEDKSVQAVSFKIQKILDEKVSAFADFSPFLQTIVTRIEMGTGLYLNRQHNISNLYKAIYSSYVRNN